MSVSAAKYKGIDGFSVTTDKLRAVFLPGEGGKAVSVKSMSSGREFLLQNASETFLHLGEDGEFEKCECAGFDDMFPTIDPDLGYPDHGEACRLRYDLASSPDEAVMTATSEKFGYRVTKTVGAADGGGILIRYEIKNLGYKPLNALYAAHCLVNVERGGRVEVPFPEGEEVDLVSDSRSLYGKSGSRVEYRAEMLATEYDESVPDNRKLYFPAPVNAGEVGYSYPDGEKFVLRFDNGAVRYVGIWIDNGGINGLYTVGLEPCTAGYDSPANARRRGHDAVILPGEKINFEFTIEAV